MSSGIFSKLGRALSIFGVSSPEDLAERKRIQARRNASTAQAEPPADPQQQPSIEHAKQKRPQTTKAQSNVKLEAINNGPGSPIISATMTRG